MTTFLAGAAVGCLVLLAAIRYVPYVADLVTLVTRRDIA